MSSSWKKIYPPPKTSENKRSPQNYASLETKGIRCSMISMYGISYINPYIYMGVSKNWGTPKWMVKIMENPIS